MSERDYIETDAEGADILVQPQLHDERSRPVFQCLLSAIPPGKTYMFIPTSLQLVFKRHNGRLGLATVLVELAGPLDPVDFGPFGCAPLTRLF